MQVHHPALLALVAVSFISTAAQQKAPTGSATGEIRCQDGNTPARGAKVFLTPLSALISDKRDSSSPTAREETTETDFAGTYSISGLAPGTYILSANLPGYTIPLDYLRTVLGRLTPDQRRRVLATFPSVLVTPASEAHQNLVLTRGGSIEGSVSVDTGGLVGDNSVRATLVSSPVFGSIEGAGELPFSYVQGAQLDDLGHFRIAGLPPGSYLLSVSLKEHFMRAEIDHGQFLGLLPSRTGTANLELYPPSATSRAKAKLVTVRADERVTGADLVVPTRLLHSIGGIVLADGVPAAHVNVMLRRPDQPLDPTRDSSYPIPDAITDEKGAFRFDLVPSGPYKLTARRFDHSEGHPAAATELQISLGEADIPDLLVPVPSSLTAQH